MFAAYSASFKAETRGRSSYSNSLSPRHPFIRINTSSRRGSPGEGRQVVAEFHYSEPRFTEQEFLSARDGVQAGARQRARRSPYLARDRELAAA